MYGPNEVFYAVFKSGFNCAHPFLALTVQVTAPRRSAYGDSTCLFDARVVLP